MLENYIKLFGGRSGEGRGRGGVVTEAWRECSKREGVIPITPTQLLIIKFMKFMSVARGKGLFQLLLHNY